MPTWLNERLLVLRCQSGDDIAFEELVVLFTPRLRYYIQKIICNEHTGEDVLQTVWSDVYLHFHQLRSIHAFRSWIYRIAHNHAVRELRTQARWPKSLDATSFTPATNDDEISFVAEEAEFIHRLIEHLPHDQREVLVLRFLEDMSYEEIAEAVECPVGTVRSRLYYGKAALRAKILKEKENGRQ